MYKRGSIHYSSHPLPNISWWTRTKTGVETCRIQSFLLIYSSHIRNARSPLLNTRSLRNVSSLHVIRHGGGEVGKLPKLDSCTARKENKLLSKESHWDPKSYPMLSSCVLGYVKAGLWWRHEGPVTTTYWIKCFFEKLIYLHKIITLFTLPDTTYNTNITYSTYITYSTNITYTVANITYTNTSH